MSLTSEEQEFLVVCRRKPIHPDENTLLSIIDKLQAELKTAEERASSWRGEDRASQDRVQKLEAIIEDTHKAVAAHGFEQAGTLPLSVKTAMDDLVWNIDRLEVKLAESEILSEARRRSVGNWSDCHDQELRRADKLENQLDELLTRAEKAEAAAAQMRKLIIQARDQEYSGVGVCDCDRCALCLMDAALSLDAGKFRGMTEEESAKYAENRKALYTRNFDDELKRELAGAVERGTYESLKSAHRIAVAGEIQLKRELEAAREERDELKHEVGELRAARQSYADLFGGDVGSIHQNIRELKAYSKTQEENAKHACAENLKAWAERDELQVKLKDAEERATAALGVAPRVPIEWPWKAHAEQLEKENSELKRELEMYKGDFTADVVCAERDAAMKENSKLKSQLEQRTADLNAMVGNSLQAHGSWAATETERDELKSQLSEIDQEQRIREEALRAQVAALLTVFKKCVVPIETLLASNEANPIIELSVGLLLTFKEAALACRDYAMHKHNVSIADAVKAWEAKVRKGERARIISILGQIRDSHERASNLPDLEEFDAAKNDEIRRDFQSRFFAVRDVIMRLENDQLRNVSRLEQAYKKELMKKVYERIAHGDEEHRQWLKTMCETLGDEE